MDIRYILLQRFYHLMRASLDVQCKHANLAEDENIKENQWVYGDFHRFIKLTMFTCSKKKSLIDLPI